VGTACTTYSAVFGVGVCWLNKNQIIFKQRLGKGVLNAHPRSSLAITIRANCSESATVAATFGECVIGSPRKRIAATIEAAISAFLLGSLLP